MCLSSCPGVADAAQLRAMKTPLGPSQFTKECLQTFLVDNNVVSTETSWKARASDIGKDRGFKKHPGYPAQCSSTCQCAHPRHVSWHACLIAALEGLMAEVEKARPQRMLMADLEDGHGPPPPRTQRRFACVSSFLKRGGPQAFRLNLCECEEVVCQFVGWLCSF